MLISCAAVIALTAVNIVLLRGSLWFSPPGVVDSRQFVTLGQYSPERRFGPVSKHDLRRVQDIDASLEYAAYAQADADLHWDSNKWGDESVAVVSDNFFNLLGVHVIEGSLLNAANRGVVLSYRFWREQLHAKSGIIGTSMVVNEVSLPVLGILAPAFRGLDESQPSVWVSDSYTSAFFDLALPLPPEVAESVKQDFSQEIPFFYGILKHDHASRAHAGISSWTVRDTASITLTTPTGPLILGFDARGNRPAVLPRIELNPEKTAVIKSYLTILAILNTALVFIVILNLVSFWTARTSERSQELHTLVAIGATRFDLFYQFSRESMPFLLLVVTLAVPFSWLQLYLLKETDPFATYLAAREVELGLQDFLPGLMLLIGIGAIAVVLPWTYIRGNVLRSQSVGVSSTTQKVRLVTMWFQWTFSAMVAAAVAASFLEGYRLSNASWGADSDPLLVRVDAMDVGARERLLSLLSLDEAEPAFIDTPPLTRLQIRSDSYLTDGEGAARRYSLYFNEATPSAFQVLGLDILFGRVFASHSESEVVLSEAAAKHFNSDLSSLVGKHIMRINSLDAAHDKTYTIVGVVKNAAYNDVRSTPESVVYTAFTGSTRRGVLILPHQYSSMIQMLRQSLTTGADRQVVRALDQIQPMSKRLADQVRTEVLLSFFTFVYAVIALAMMGLGLLATARTQLTHRGREVALRVALGAGLKRAAFDFVRTPFLVATAGVIPVLILSAVMVFRGLMELPMINGVDWFVLLLLVSITIAVFCAMQLILVRRRLARYNLSELLRVER